MLSVIDRSESCGDNVGGH